MRTIVYILLAEVLLMTLACVNTKKLTGAEILPKEQSNRNEQHQDAGRDVNNMTVNIVGDEVLGSGAAILGLMAFGWWHAARGRKVQSVAVREIVQGVEMSKRTLKRELDNARATTDLTVKCPVQDVLAWMKVANNFHQTARTRAIVRKIRNKPEKKDEKEIEEKDNSKSDG